MPTFTFACPRFQGKITPLLEPEINASRFYDIEPDQAEQIFEVFARHLTGGEREMVMRMLEFGIAWSADIFVS